MINPILASLLVAILLRCPLDTVSNILRPHYSDQIKISDLSPKGQLIHYISKLFANSTDRVVICKTNNFISNLDCIPTGYWSAFA